MPSPTGRRPAGSSGAPRTFTQASERSRGGTRRSASGTCSLPCSTSLTSCRRVRALVRPAAGMDQLQIIASSWVEDVEEEEGYCPAGNVHDDSSWAMVEKQLASTDTGLGPQGRGGEEAAVDRELSRRNLGTHLITHLLSSPPLPLLLLLCYFLSFCADKAVEDNDVGDESSTIVSPFAG
eukprot:765161-Hanusia_phi.AAC.2